MGKACYNDSGTAVLVQLTMRNGLTHRTVVPPDPAMFPHQGPWISYHLVPREGERGPPNKGVEWLRVGYAESLLSLCEKVDARNVLATVRRALGDSVPRDSATQDMFARRTGRADRPLRALQDLWALGSNAVAAEVAPRWASSFRCTEYYLLANVLPPHMLGMVDADLACVWAEMQTARGRARYAFNLCAPEALLSPAALRASGLLLREPVDPVEVDLFARWVAAVTDTTLPAAAAALGHPDFVAAGLVAPVGVRGAHLPVRLAEIVNGFVSLVNNDAGLFMLVDGQIDAAVAAAVASYNMSNRAMPPLAQCAVFCATPAAAAYCRRACAARVILGAPRAGDPLPAVLFVHDLHAFGAGEVADVLRMARACVDARVPVFAAACACAPFAGRLFDFALENCERVVWPNAGGGALRIVDPEVGWPRQPYSVLDREPPALRIEVVRVGAGGGALALAEMHRRYPHAPVLVESHAARTRVLRDWRALRPTDAILHVGATVIDSYGSQATVASLSKRDACAGLARAHALNPMLAADRAAGVVTLRYGNSVGGEFDLTGRSGRAPIAPLVETCTDQRLVPTDVVIVFPEPGAAPPTDRLLAAAAHVAIAAVVVVAEGEWIDALPPHVFIKTSFTPDSVFSL